MPLPSDDTTPPVTKTYFTAPARHGCLPSASSSRSTGVRSISSPSERTVTEEIEGGEGADRNPSAARREPAHGTQA